MGKVIGIDSGTSTGFAVYNTSTGNLEKVDTVMIHQALFMVMDMFKQDQSIFVRVEDARKRKWIPHDSGRERLQGAGSIKRDSKIWQDFLESYHIKFEMVAPKNNKTKTKSDLFQKITGWTNKCSEHARDAAMLCFKFDSNYHQLVKRYHD